MRWRSGVGSPSAGASFRGMAGPTASKSSSSNLASPVRTRSKFPETWIWLNKTISNSGDTSIPVTVPDTITQWITSAFAVNPAFQFGVAESTTNITTFQRFFMRFELPYASIRGEVLVLQITVFNYIEKDLEVHVGLSNNENITFIDSNGQQFTPPKDGWSKVIKVQKNSVKSVFFPLMPTKIGITTLKATARSTEAADAVERTLLVKPEGIRQNYNLPVLIDLRKQNSVSTSVDITFPDNVIPDSEFIKVLVIGDLIGNSLSGVEDLLKMSYGCGEQNMVLFAPNVFIASYLNSTRRLTSELKDKVGRLLSAGYQRQLSYAHRDGSFSAFGRSDNRGSTWLTAFVLKSFAQASNFTYIDPNVISKALRFLLGQQSTKGEFKEKGKVYQRSLQGGSASSSATMTAYVVIALHEARQHNQIAQNLIKRTNDSIKRANRFITQSILVQKNIATFNLYELVISTYALSLQGIPLSNTLLSQIETRANVTDDGKFWKLPDTEADVIQSFRSWAPPKKQVRAIDIEITSYVLSIYSTKNDVSNGVKVLKWVNRQRNPYGGFISTQDTVVAIQAITDLAQRVFTPKFTASVLVKGDKWTGRSFTVEDKNALVLQTEDIPRTTRRIDVTATGHGFVLVEIAVFFNVLEELRKPAFDLSLSITDDSLLGFRLTVCFNWLRGGNSTMGYLQIGKPTGTEIDTDSLDVGKTGLFRRKEVSGDNLDLYFDWVTSKKICVSFNVDRVSLVVNQMPVPVRLSEYYEQSNEVITMYQSKTMSNASLKEVCGAENCQ